MIQGKIGLEFPSVLLELLLLPGYGLCQGLGWSRGCLQLKALPKSLTSQFSNLS